MPRLPQPFDQFFQVRHLIEIQYENRNFEGVDQRQRSLSVLTELTFPGCPVRWVRSSVSSRERATKFDRSAAPLAVSGRDARLGAPIGAPKAVSCIGATSASLRRSSERRQSVESRMGAVA